MARHVYRQFQPAPDTQLVKRAAQVILDYLLAGSHDFSDFPIGQTLPYQNRDLNFLGGKVFSGCH